VIANLDAGTEYVFRITVRGIDGHKVVKLVTANTPDLSPPLITSGPTFDILVRDLTEIAWTADEAPRPTADFFPGGLTEIAWTTDEAADSRVRYGESLERMNRVAGSIDYGVNHSVKLTGLQPDAIYYYQVITMDPAGNATTSPIYDFVAELPNFTLTVTSAGTGSGTLSGDGTFPLNTLVTPTATPETGSILADWVPDKCGSSFELTDDTTCVALFEMVSEVPGDLDGDGDVDRNDLNLLLANRNSPARGPDDPEDLDGDGTITVLDARKLVLLCTRTRCATE
jgi:hypothetical protein